ncbi:MAG: DUF1579 family protein [Pirellulales bacterium]|nr:DUF1579 family protein [Pirellulales bacterium]
MDAACRPVSTWAVRFTALFFVGLALPATRATADEAPPETLAELERFLGDWKTRTQIRHFGPPPREFDTQGEATCRRTLEGRFLEFRAQSVPPGEADLQIMTYDTAADLYRQWVFASDGYYHEAVGKWNRSTSVLRWTGKTADASFVIDDRWVSPDRLEWTLQRTDASGKPTQTIQGTLTRVKPSEP